MARERIASSVTTPPALRNTCASPSCRPRILWTSSRASMQATTASFFAGGSGRSPFLNEWAYESLLRTRSSVTLMAMPPESDVSELGDLGPPLQIPLPCWERVQCLFRLATEAAGAARVIDRAPPRENRASVGHPHSLPTLMGRSRRSLRLV